MSFISITPLRRQRKFGQISKLKYIFQSLEQQGSSERILDLEQQRRLVRQGGVHCRQPRPRLLSPLNPDNTLSVKHTEIPSQILKKTHMATFISLSNAISSAIVEV